MCINTLKYSHLLVFMFTCIRTCTMQGGSKKQGHKLTAIILANFNRFSNFFTVRFLGKFAVSRLLKIPPFLAYVANLPHTTL